MECCLDSCSPICCLRGRYIFETCNVEIGRCDKVNFHPHSKEPPLFEEATHVEVDSGSRVTLKDLR